LSHEDRESPERIREDKMHRWTADSSKAKENGKMDIPGDGQRIERILTGEGLRKEGTGRCDNCANALK
jgi:hypothetical protein